MTGNGSWRRSTGIAICRREAWSHWRSAWFYGIAVLSLVVSALLVSSYLDYIAEAGMLVASSPLYPPLLVVALLAAACTGLWAATTVAGEQERGTLGVLFFGPVDSTAYLAGKFGGLLAAYLVLIGLNCAFLVAASAFTNLPLPPGFAWMVLLICCSGSAAIALGLALSCLSNRVRGAVFLYLIVLLALGGLALIPTLLSAGLLSMGAAARDLLSAVLTVVDWLSPFGYVGRGLDGLIAGDVPLSLANLAIVILYAAVALLLGVVTLNRKGVMRP